MTELDQLASEIGVSGRTLRRAGERETIRWMRRSPRAITVSAQEYEYVRSHWPLLERALQVLRTRPRVRLAVLFGSVAVGDARPNSDVDVLVRVRGGWREQAETALALENALGRPVQLVSLDRAPPRLLADALRDGRVLADRDGEWVRLKRRSRSIARAARDDDARLEHAAWGDARPVRRARGVMAARPPLPMSIKTRLAETRKHATALKALLAGTTKEAFVAAVADGSAGSLVTKVYPLERAFEILVNFVVELAELGLELAEIVPDSSSAKVLEQLETQGVISKSRRERLATIHRARSEMQHAYPDVGAQATYEAARSLLDELGGFFGDYARWLRELGYG